MICSFDETLSDPPACIELACSTVDSCPFPSQQPYIGPVEEQTTSPGPGSPPQNPHPPLGLQAHSPRETPTLDRPRSLVHILPPVHGDPCTQPACSWHCGPLLSHHGHDAPLAGRLSLLHFLASIRLPGHHHHKMMTVITIPQPNQKRPAQYQPMQMLLRLPCLWKKAAHLWTNREIRM